jgi:hypothetical protein
MQLKVIGRSSVPLVVDLDLLVTEVKQDGAVDEPLIVAEVPNQPDLAQKCGRRPFLIPARHPDKVQAYRMVVPSPNSNREMC